MTKCKKCGTVFGSKFCPECGAPADETVSTEESEKQAPLTVDRAKYVETTPNTEASEKASDEWVPTELEKQIRERGVPYALRKNTKNYLPVRVMFIVFTVALTVAVMALGIKLCLKINDLCDADPITLLVIYDDAISQIKSLCITLSVIAVVHGLVCFLSDQYRDIKVCKWLKSQDINATQIILNGIVENGGILNSDKDEFVETKRYLYDAKCENVHAEKKYLKFNLIDLLCDIVFNTIFIVLLYKACNSLEITYEGKIEFPLSYLIACLVVFVMPIIIMHFVKKFFKTRESDIDYWARQREKEAQKKSKSE